jgi:periplasmic divalent cation tolerance protein
MNPSDYCIVSTTTDTKENAEVISQALLQKKLIACVQSSTIDSSYKWKGKIIHAKEIRLQMKTKKSLFTQITAEIEALHTYDVPEIIMVPLVNANEFYLKWIDSETL